VSSPVLARAGFIQPAPHPQAVARVVIAGTSDLHGVVRSWNYDADAVDPHVGLAKVATLVRALRSEYGQKAVLLLDAGDTLQGTPMMLVAAKGELPAGPHPMSAAMRELGYTAAALGNHDVEYGFDVLDSFTSTCGFPVLASNASGPRAAGMVGGLIVDAVAVPVADEPSGAAIADPLRRVRVGVIGLTNPGIPVWTKLVVDGRLDVGDLVAAATATATELLAAGAETIVVTAHSGTCPFSSYGDVVPWLENAATLVAEQVPGVAAVLAGHAHADVSELRVERVDGAAAVVTEPSCYGQRLSVIHLDVADTDGRWEVVAAAAQTLDTSVADEDALVVAAVDVPHRATRVLLSTRLGELDRDLDLSGPLWRPSPPMELLARIAGEAAIAGMGDAAMSGVRGVVGVVSKVYRGGVLRAGALRVRDVGSLYRFDNRLVTVRLTGRQLVDYLDWSARFFKPAVDSSADPANLLRAPVPDAPFGLPDYDFDIAVGVGSLLTYDIDVSRAVGSRVRRLSVDGAAVADSDEFAVVLTEYRHNGSRNYPHVRTADVLWRSEGYLRDLVEAHVRRVRVVDVAALTRPGWRLTVGDEALTGTVILNPGVTPNARTRTPGVKP
jgi:2',3'-cyclic-nucleotide 2'-phosphodiesterase/3'-nucleotidase